MSEYGEWDFKNNQVLVRSLQAEGLYNSSVLDEFGNFHFGMTAAARGYSLSVTLAGAGAYQTFFQGGGSPGAAIAGGMLWASRYSGAPGYYYNDSLTRTQTYRGFTWGDNPGDSFNAMRGWDYQNGG